MLEGTLAFIPMDAADLKALLALFNKPITREYPVQYAGFDLEPVNE